MNWRIGELTNWRMMGCALCALALLAGCATETSDNGRAGAPRPPQSPEAQKLGNIETQKPAETPDQIAEKLRLEARGLENWYKVKPGHEAKLRAALAVEGISHKERQLIVSDLVRKVLCMENETAYANAKKVVEPILAEPAMTNNASRIAYTVMLSDAAFRSSQPDEAKRLVDGLWKLPKLQWFDTNAVFNARVGIDLKMKDYVAARAAYRKVFENAGEPAARRFDCLKACVELWSEDMLWDEGLAALATWDGKKLGRRFEVEELACRLMREKGEFDAVRRKVDAIAAATYKSARDKKLADELRLAEYLRCDLDQNDFKAATRDLQAGAETYRNAVNPLAQIVEDFIRRAEIRHDWDAIIVAFEVKPGYELRWGYNWKIRDRFLAYFKALRARGRIKEIPASIAKLLASGKVSAEDTAMFTIIAAGIRVPHDRDGVGSRVPRDRTDLGRAGAPRPPQSDFKSSILKAVEKLNPRQKLSALAAAAKFFVSGGDRATALAIYDVRQSLMIVRPRNHATVAYVKDAPFDVGGWLASGLLDRLEKHVVDVPFDSDEAAKLILDVSVQRNVGNSGGESETYFYVCWDEFGVHLFFYGKDPEWRKVLEGSVGSTGYEMYLCFGEGEVMHQWMLDSAKGPTEFLNYASPSKEYRPLKDHLRMTTSPAGDGFATAMNIAWSACYDRLPENGTKWPFEIIHWSRGGGVTWGGETTWQISRWGRWEFADMTDALKTAIKRSLLRGAVERFRAQSAIGQGEITVWKDREIGDPVFYAKVLKPLADKLEADIRLLPEADAATIDRLYAEDMGPLFDFKIYADCLREEYLRDGLTER